MDQSTGTPQVTPDLNTAPSEEVEYCYGHPKTPTKLHCTRCERPICGRCAIPASVGQHCPECVAEARKSAPKVRTAMQKNAPVVMTILAINIVMYLGQQLVPGLTDRLLMWPPGIDNGEYWRLLTPMFLHGGIFHIFMNSYILYIFGPTVEQSFGKVKFALLYLAAGFMGNVASYVIPPDNASLGASGAVFGLAGVLLVYLYKRRTSTFVMQHLRSISFFIVANVVLGFTLLAGVVDNYAHLGGLLGGIILGAGFDREDALAPLTQALSLLAVLGGGVLLVLLRIGGGIG